MKDVEAFSHIDDCIDKSTERLEKNIKDGKERLIIAASNSAKKQLYTKKINENKEIKRKKTIVCRFRLKT